MQSKGMVAMDKMVDKNTIETANSSSPSYLLASIAVVIGALFVRLAAKIPAKASALAHHLAYAFPAARCELAKATSGYNASFNAFETLAPALPEED